MTVVDIHCHTFNADDLPVRGFVQRVAFHNKFFTGDLAALIDRIIQGAAPGYREEKLRLDQMLAPLPGREMAPSPVTAETLEAEVDSAIAELERSDPELLRRAAFDLDGRRPTPAPEIGGPEGVRDVIDTARRAVRWAKLFGKQRIDITTVLLSTFDRFVDLYTPLLVDLGMGLDDTAKVSIREQVELHEKISRLSMLDRLPGDGGHVHGFVGFDPRRQLRARETNDIEEPLDVVRSAIADYGFVGIKLYPPMGFKPYGNAAEPDVPDGEAIDVILGELYEWCVSNDVPLTAHCNDSNYADPAFRQYASPDNWALALQEFPGLRVNLGHFGGARTDEGSDGWPWRAAALAAERPNVFADVGNHKIYDERIRTDYFDMLEAMFEQAATAGMDRRLMFGSDWYMLASHPDHRNFLADYERHYRSRFGDERAERFLGGNALTFLGFDDPTNANNRRLVARYRRFEADLPHWLADS